jgi:LysM repeat protein
VPRKEGWAVNYRTLGQTGLKVSEIAIGAFPLSGRWTNADGSVQAWSGSEDAESIALIHRAEALGVNLIDTAEGYGYGYSEEVVGRALAGSRRDKWVIATKVQPNAGLERDDADPARARVLGLPSEPDARATLQMVKAHYAALLPELEEEPSFKEKVEIKTLPLPAALWRSTPAVAAAALWGAAEADAGEYRVKPGDTASEIAHAHHLALAELQRLNPGVTLHLLRSGRVLRVRPAPKPPVTVIVKRTVRAPQLVPFATRRSPARRWCKASTSSSSPAAPAK